MAYRIGVVTADIENDWASNELLAVVCEHAKGNIVDPLSFRMSVDGKCTLTLAGEPTDTYDAFIIRAFNRRGEADYQYEVLELLNHQRKLVVNSPSSLSISESKAQTTFCLRTAGFPVPRTTVTQSLDEARDVIRAYGTAVIKPLYGSHGIDMEKLDSDSDTSILSKFFDKYSVIYVQEFVPNAGRDIRAFVVGDEVPAAIYRVAKPGQWKTNVARGGTTEPCELPPKLRELCLEATRAIGLDYTGIDVMEGPDGPLILELNGAPWWHGLMEATGLNVAQDVVRHVLRKLDAGQTARRPSEL